LLRDLRRVLPRVLVGADRRPAALHRSRGVVRLRDRRGELLVALRVLRADRLELLLERGLLVLRALRRELGRLRGVGLLAQDADRLGELAELLLGPLLGQARREDRGAALRLLHGLRLPRLADPPV